MKKIFSILFLAALVMVACEKGNEEAAKPTITITSGDVVEFGGEGGQKEITFTLANSNDTKVNISESDYTMVNKDLDIAMTFDALGREKFEGNVDIIYPTINAATHTFPVQITVKNEDLKVRPGMYGKAVVNFGSQKHVVVPDMAVKKQAGSGDFYVYTYEDGIVKHNKVKLGRRMGNRYELISGVKPGAYVVVAGVEKLVDGIEVEVINKEQDKK